MASAPVTSRIQAWIRPAVYLGHGAPPLVDDALWVSELQRWAADLPKPKQVLVVSDTKNGFNPLDVEQVARMLGGK